MCHSHFLFLDTGSGNLNFIFRASSCPSNSSHDTQLSRHLDRVTDFQKASIRGTDPFTRDENGAWSSAFCFSGLFSDESPCSANTTSDENGGWIFDLLRLDSRARRRFYFLLPLFFPCRLPLFSKEPFTNNINKICSSFCRHPALRLSYRPLRVCSFVAPWLTTK